MADDKVIDPKPFDAAAYMKEANEREIAARTGKPVPAKPAEPAKPVEPAAKTPEPDEDHEETDKRISRSDRRKLKYVEEAAFLRGKLEALEAERAKPAVPSAPDDPEPLRSAYKTDAEHQRALGRWDARQEAKGVVDKEKESAEKAELEAMYNKVRDENHRRMDEQVKAFPNWEELKEKVADLKFPAQVVKLIELSESRGYILGYLAENDAEREKLLELGEGPLTLKYFGRLEERVEKMYTSESKTAAQAENESSKDRGHPAEAKAGRNSAERDSGKPRPSTEVAARGGSATPEAPKPGTKEWMEAANLREFARRG